MEKRIRIGTRESQLAVWQAQTVKNLLEAFGYSSELVLITSEGDIDLKTPLYEMGVQGVFTRNLDSALINKRIDIAVHSMKDVPTQLPIGIVQAAVLQRASFKDLLVLKDGQTAFAANGQYLGGQSNVTIATSSIRRKAQWLHRYPGHQIENLRGNVNTRLRKLSESHWTGAIFAAAGLERIGLRPDNALELDWMLPAPAQGAILIASLDDNDYCMEACEKLNHKDTALCTKIERDFLKGLSGGCSTPISALAEIDSGDVYFRGSILSPDGKHKLETEKILPLELSDEIGIDAAREMLEQDDDKLIEQIRHASK